MTWTITVEAATPSPNELRPIPGFTGYAASPDGRVFSKRIPLKKMGMADSWREMARVKDHKGYFRIRLQGDHGSVTMKVHRLMVMAFIGDIPQGMTVNHKDGNKTNNSINNLEVLSNPDNIRHSYASGLRDGKVLFGSSHGMSKLSEDQAIEIIMLCGLGIEKQRDIAKRYGITQANVSLIHLGKKWGHLRCGK